MENGNPQVIYSLDKIFNSDKPVLIDFYEPCSASCEKLIPVIKEVKQVMGNRMRVIKIDIGRNKNLVNAYQIKNLPTMMLYQNGKQLWRKSGLASKTEILGTILQKSN